MRYGYTPISIVSHFLVVSIISMLVIATALPLVQAKEIKQARVQKEEGLYRIGFHLWKPGKIYDEALAGIKDGLALEGIRYEEVLLHSNRDKALALENLRKLDAMGLDLIYSLSSAGTKIAKEVGLATPIIATVINHPASLGIGEENSDLPIKITGTSYYIDAKKQLMLYLDLFPQTEKVGMIYDANNPAGYLAEEPFMRVACEELGMEFVSVGVRETTDLEAAAKKLVDAEVNIIVIPTNRLVYGNLSIVLDVTNKHKLPVVSMNKQGVEYGALAALFADTYNLGRQTAAMAKQVLVDKANPTEIVFQYIPVPDVILNLNSADKLDYEFPAGVLGKASIVLQ